MAVPDLQRFATDDSATRNYQRFDGQFYSAVLTTGIYCRPGCPGKPRAENVRFFSTAAAAAEAGFRPCLRCHPESAPDPPEWQRTSPVVTRALRLIGEGALDDGGVSELARQMHVSARQLQRLFVDELGAPPVAVAQTRRLLFAKKLIDETDLRMADIAFSAGYSSVRRFNEAIQQTYARTPTELRRKRRRSVSSPTSAFVELKLFYRDPYNWPVMLAFLTEQGIPGVETVERNVYRRTVRVGEHAGAVYVRPLGSQRVVQLRVPATLTRYLLPISERIKQIFDLKADPVTIDDCLTDEPSLAGIVRDQRGVRVPGCWDGFEVALHALAEMHDPGRGRELMGKLAERFGDKLPDLDDPLLTRLFPTPERLADAPLGDVLHKDALADSITSLARAVVDRSVRFDGSATFECLSEQLGDLPGMEPELIQYVALRAIGEPDLDLAGDRLLRDCGAAANPGNCAGWRSYAAMYRWAAARSSHPIVV